MLRIIRSLFGSVSTAIRNNPEVERLIANHPQAATFIAKRFSRAKPIGLRLTIGVALAFCFLILFFGVAQDLVANDPLVQADLRLVSLVQLFRAPTFDNIMVFITYLGNWQVVLTGAALMTVYLALSRRWLWLAALAFSIGGGEALVLALKSLFGRPRPDLVNALVPAQGPSFPSGHAFTAFAFYGLVAWFAINRASTWHAKLVLTLMATIGIAALGFSRIYLGVHWPSDVLASYALGAAWLTTLITVLTVAEARAPGTPSPAIAAVPVRIAGLLGMGWVVAAAAFYLTHPLIRKPKHEQVVVALSENNFPIDLFAIAPRFSEDIIGKPMEPINIIMVGSESDLSRAFKQAGWKPTDSITAASTWRLVVAVLRDRPYATAPGIPTFWGGTPNQRGFERPTSRNSARERQHLHLWGTSFYLNGTPVWLGTVHLDSEATTTSGVRLPIHQIDPEIDQARDALRVDFSRASCVARTAEVSITKPMMGQNAGANPFYTDGKALTAFLKCG